MSKSCYLWTEILNPGREVKVLAKNIQPIEQLFFNHAQHLISKQFYFAVNHMKSKSAPKKINPHIVWLFWTEPWSQSPTNSVIILCPNNLTLCCTIHFIESPMNLKQFSIVVLTPNPPSPLSRIMTNKTSYHKERPTPKKKCQGN